MVCTSMGTKAAPPYANLFTNCHKETIQEVFICAILFSKRFIGDIFLIFQGTTNQLQFLEEKDLRYHLHSTIKFAFNTPPKRYPS